MQGQDLGAISRLTEGEAARTAYPEGFPALPVLPAARYTSERFHQLELQHLWRKTWLYAAHETELPDPGDYKLFERLGLSVIVSRGAAGEIRAFHNVCRHRGSPLLTEKRGRAKRFLCPYHAWGYTLEGRLASVPEAHNFCNLDKAARGLLPVRCESWRGQIFVNLDAEALSLADYLGALAVELEGAFPLEDMEVKHTATVPIRCNWKVAYDNFVEIYHAPMVHPKTVMPYFDPATFSISLFRNGHSRYVVRRKLDAAEGAPLLQAADLFSRFTVGVMPFPNMIGALDPAGYPWVTFWPTGVGTVDMEVQLVGRNGGDPEHWDRTMAYVLKVFEEDVRLLSRIQTSLEGGFVGGLTLGYAERIIYWYHEEIDRVIGRENIPADVRVQPVLAEHAVG